MRAWTRAVLLGCVPSVGLAAAGMLFVQCGARTGLLVPDVDAESLLDGGDAHVTDAHGDSPVVDLCGDAGAIDAGPCTGIACDIPDCGAGQHTTITTTVYDPSGKRPLYDALVYVPNGPLDAFFSGTICATCQAAASGHPIVSGVTDTHGRVTLTDPPAGSYVPIVMQIGKWRREIAVSVTACTNNTFDDPSTFRLPRNGAEGDMPLIAFASGCDNAQCFLSRTVGIDPSEFTGPSGSGHVHVYESPYGDATKIPGPLGNPYDLWGDLSEMKKYDILFNACECTPYPRTTDPKKHAYENMKAYLEGGGRMFGTHYHYNWFSPPDGPPDFQKQAPWLDAPQTSAPVPFFVDTSHPRGKAYAEWLTIVGVSTQPGQLALQDTRADVGGLNGGKPGSGSYTNSTQWLYHPANLSLYLSFNAPTTQPAGSQCGRAVFSDVHLSGSIGTSAFPAYCAAGHESNELALEFLFFDLASCVQDDTKAPQQPCTK